MANSRAVNLKSASRNWNWQLWCFVVNRNRETTAAVWFICNVFLSGANHCAKLLQQLRTKLN